MATRKPDEPKRPPGEDDLARIYRAATADGPSPALDARILAEARSAMTAMTKPKPFRWAVPLSTAAVVVLAVGVVLLMTRQGVLHHRTEPDVPNAYTAAPASPPLADAHEEGRAVEPAKAKHAAPTAPMKKAEAPVVTAVPATAPRTLGAAQEADRLSVAREEKARARSAPAGVAAMKAEEANVVAVQASGTPGAYSFNVTVKSPDTGCQQYADWWEVVSEDGKLLYRRVLFHSHVGEQPFTRSGGPVPVQTDTIVWVRAHMNTRGYGSVAAKGSVKTGFTRAEPPADFAAGLAKQPPLPDGCAF